MVLIIYDKTGIEEDRKGKRRNSDYGTKMENGNVRKINET